MGLQAWASVKVKDDAKVGSGEDAKPHPRAGQAGVTQAPLAGTDNVAVKFDSDFVIEQLDPSLLVVLAGGS